MARNGQQNTSFMAVEHAQRAEDGTSVKSPAPAGDNQISSSSSNTITSDTINHPAIHPTVNDPTPPRRLSSGDEDPARPRKRPATLASIQQIEVLNAEHIAARQQERKSPPSHLLGHAGFHRSSPIHIPSDSDVEMALSLNGKDLEVNGQSSVVTKDETVSFAPSPSLDSGTEVGDVLSSEDSTLYTTEQGTLVNLKANSENNNPSEPSYITMDKAKEPSDDASSSTSSLQYERQSESPEVEVAEVEDLDDPAVDLCVIEDQVDECAFVEFPLIVNSKDYAEEFLFSLSQQVEKDPAPVVCLYELERCVSTMAKQDPKAFNENFMLGEQAWLLVPHIIDKFLRRRESFHLVDFGKPIPEYGANGLQLTLVLFDAFLRMSTRMMQLDLQILRSRTSNMPFNPSSIEFLQVSAELFSQDWPLYVTLENSFSADLLPCQYDSARKFVQEMKGLVHFRQLVEKLLEKIPLQPALFSSLLMMLKLPININVILRNFAKQADEKPDSFKALLQAVTDENLEIYRVCQANINKFIESGVGIPKLEFSKFVSECIAPMLGFVLLADPLRYAVELETSGLIKFSEYPPDTYSELGQTAVRLGTYNRALRKCKKIELRLHALTCICEELLTAWNRYNLVLENATLRYLGKFIEETKMIEHLFGQHSHFQLIQKAGNVVGYTLVYKTFNKQLHDVIWRPVLENKDQRIVHAILSLLKETIASMPLEQLYWCCDSLQEVPLSAYDNVLLELLQNIVQQLCHPTYNIGRNKKLEFPPYDLLIKLMHESFKAGCNVEPSSSANYQNIFDFTSKELQRLLDFGPPEDDKLTVFNNCIDSLQQNGPTATCALQILQYLCSEQVSKATDADSTSLMSILEEKNLIPLIVQNLATCVEAKESFDVLCMKLRPHYDFLHLIILNSPTSISLDQGRELWSYLCGERSSSPRLRDHSFGFFGNVIQAAVHLRQFNNEFLKTCFQQYFAELGVSYLVASALEFCMKSIDLLKKGQQSTDLETDHIVVFDGMDQIWRIILEAPRQDLAQHATTYFVNMYLDSPQIIRNTPEVIEATHATIIQRCITQLTDAAKVLQQNISEDAQGDDMVIDLTATQIAHKGLEFKRSLMVLTEFLRGHKARPRYALDAAKAQIVSVSEGNPLTIKFQWFARGITSAVQTVRVGDLTRCDEFYSFLVQYTSLPDFRLITNGAEVYYKEEPKTLRAMSLTDGQFFLVQKRPSPDDDVPSTAVKLTFVELETLKHFDKLYELLDLPENYSNLIWTLLRQFPPQKRVRDVLNDPSSLSKDVFATGKPFRIHYTLYTLKYWLKEHQVEEPTVDEKLLSAVTWLYGAILASDKIEARARRVSITNMMFELFLPSLQALVNDHGKVATFEATKFVKRIFELFEESCALELPDSGHLAVNAFRALVLMSACNKTVWNVMTENAKSATYIGILLLKDPRQVVRQGVRAEIETCCQAGPFKEGREGPVKDEERTNFINEQEFCVYFWSIVQDLFSDAERFSSIAGEMFSVACTIFQQLRNSRWDGLTLNTYAYDWKSRLLSHNHVELVGHSQENFILFGYAALLIMCITFIKEDNHTLPSLAGLLDNIFGKYLFPPLTVLSVKNSLELTEVSPVLSGETRGKLYQLIELFLHTPAAVNDIVDTILDLLPGERPTYFNLDRTRWLRSESGYVGLRNQSNTCYLNSLLTQLFMNLNFRGAVFRMQVTDKVSQNLLYATQEVFANLQNSWQKAFEPRDFTLAIKDYENQPIDVSVQMDVDEFYNLLFDRMEAQIDSITDRNTFRTLYGGQLVQQVKSRECDHVSEREEPFSAIQCDIKGKQTLQDSLKAYVEGEIMDGDNKYSCTSCNRHVDAVKRTCLKQVPDNLIFHLKRFEFDLRTMLRSKINDAFEFPEKLDMRPYTIEVLSDSDANLEPDIFVLVGVLVHSGTAESGHYYSYIRERVPRNGQNNTRWFEFNDSEVSQFDPSTIASQCFGGGDPLPSKDGLPNLFIKPYSAYMLFYERESSLKSTTEQANNQASPVELEIPRALHRSVFHENELSVRKYCLFDPNHLNFVASLLRQVSKLNHGRCSDDHLLENKTLRLLLETLEGITIRIRDCNEVEAFLLALRASLIRCNNCCSAFLLWILDRPEPVKNFVLRCPSQQARKDFATLILGSLEKLRKDRPDEYGIKLVNSGDWTESRGFIQALAPILIETFEIISSHMRAWDEFFGLVAKLASFGLPESVLLLQYGFLRKCIEVLLIDLVPIATKREYGSLARLIEKGRRPPLSQLVEVISILLSRCDFNRPRCADDEERGLELNSDLVPLSDREYTYITFHNKKAGIMLINKPLDLAVNIDCVKAIVRKYVSQEPDLGLMQVLLRTLYTGVCVDPANLAAPFLQGVLAVAESIMNAADIREFVKRIALEVQTIGDAGGREHLEFFQMLYKVHNPKFRATGFIKNKVIENVSTWAPPLLVYWEDSVRTDTESFLNEHLLATDLQHETERIISKQAEFAKELFDGCYTWLDVKVLKQRQALVTEKRFEAILTVMDNCSTLIEDDDNAEVYKTKISNIRGNLERLIYDEEPAVEDWQNSDIASDSHEIDMLNDDYSNST